MISLHCHRLKLDGKSQIQPWQEFDLRSLTKESVLQIMHIGPYADEKPNIDLLHQAIADNGYKLRGKHHEIYLGDPRKSAPEKLKTIIRQPVE